MDKRVDVASRPVQTGKSQGKLWLLGGVVVLVAIAGGVTWRLTHTTVAPQGRFSGATASVLVSSAAPADIENRLAELGTVTPLAGVTVTTQISGILQSVGFTEGQTVHKGDFLAQIDDRPYRAALAQYQGTLAHDQGLLVQAQSDLARYQKLAKQDSIAAQTVADQHALVLQDQGTIKSDQGQIAAQQLNIDYCHITAPVDGVVGLRLVDPGNYVTAGSTTGIVVLNQIQPISVVFAIPEDNVPALHQSMQSGQPVPITLYDRSDSIKLADGKLGTVDNEIQTTTGTLKMRALFDNQDGNLVPNQFVNVDMLVSKTHADVAVPVAAVQTGTAGSYVYVVNDQNVASIVQVKEGDKDANLIQITSGLNAGDKVVVDGVDRLRDGIKVVPTDAATAKTQEAAAAAQPTKRRRHRRASNGEDSTGAQGSADQGNAQPKAGAAGGTPAQ